VAKDEPATEVYTDGACKGNPGPGGWAWVTTDGRFGNGGAHHTTNQRMEVEAVLEALRALTGHLHIHSDSTYVVNCFNDKWYEGWIRRGWKNSQKRPVANRDLWEPLVDLYLERRSEIDFTWVKGHAGDPMNEQADLLAVEAAERFVDSAAKAATATVAAGLPDAAWPSDRSIWVVGVTAPDKDQSAAIERAIDRLDPGADLLVSGLRRGTELEAAELALKRGVDVAVVLPFDNPADGWPPSDRERFEKVRRSAVGLVALAGSRSEPAKAVDQRNKWVCETVVGAIVVGDPGLADRVEAAGASVIRIP